MRKLVILFASLLFAILQGTYAQRTITGKAINGEDGLPMPGVSVVVKGTTIGMITNRGGNFALRVPNDAIIVVSFIGFKTIQIPVGDYTYTNYNITLQPDAIALGDVVVTARRNNQREKVVTAMGIERDPKSLPYALSHISGDEIRKVPTAGNFLDAINGKVPGAQFYKDEFGSTRIYLRGITSFDGIGPPLYVINGMPTRNADIVDLTSIYDIESVTVLRGANAAILYGSAGANGAIVITTKNPSIILQSASAQQSASLQRTIIGNIINSENEVGMSGVAVVVKGTSTIAVTDSDGNFVLKVPNDAVMIVMCMGFRTVEIPVENKSWYEIMLQPEINVLDNNDVP